MPSQARPFTRMASRFTQSALLADRQAPIPDLPGAVKSRSGETADGPCLRVSRDRGTRRVWERRCLLCIGDSGSRPAAGCAPEHLGEPAFRQRVGGLEPGGDPGLAVGPDDRVGVPVGDIRRDARHGEHGCRGGQADGAVDAARQGCGRVIASRWVAVSAEPAADCFGRLCLPGGSALGRLALSGQLYLRYFMLRAAGSGTRRGLLAESCNRVPSGDACNYSGSRCTGQCPPVLSFASGTRSGAPARPSPPR